MLTHHHFSRSENKKQNKNKKRGPATTGLFAVYGRAATEWIASTASEYP